jgi:hypothetical protein
MSITYENPLLGRYTPRFDLAVWTAPLPSAAEDEGPGIAGIANDLLDATLQQLTPVQLSFLRPAPNPPGKEQLLFMECLRDSQAGACSPEGGK